MQETRRLRRNVGAEAAGHGISEEEKEAEIYEKGLQDLMRNLNSEDFEGQFVHLPLMVVDSLFT
jgi:hypothetical protein